MVAYGRLLFSPSPTAQPSLGLRVVAGCSARQPPPGPSPGWTPAARPPRAGVTFCGPSVRSGFTPSPHCVWRTGRLGWWVSAVGSGLGSSQLYCCVPARPGAGVSVSPSAHSCLGRLAGARGCVGGQLRAVPTRVGALGSPPASGRRGGITALLDVKSLGPLSGDLLLCATTRPPAGWHCVLDPALLAL